MASSWPTCVVGRRAAKTALHNCRSLIVGGKGHPTRCRRSTSGACRQVCGAILLRVPLRAGHAIGVKGPLELRTEILERSR